MFENYHKCEICGGHMFNSKYYATSEDGKIMCDHCFQRSLKKEAENIEREYRRKEKENQKYRMRKMIDDAINTLRKIQDEIEEGHFSCL